MTQNYYVPMTQFTTAPQVAVPPKVNAERTPAVSEHENVPVNNEHQNEIVAEPIEQPQDQTANGTQEAQQEHIAEPVPIAEPQPLRRSTRERKSTISEDFMYMSEGHDMGKVDDPNSFKEAMSSEYSHKWIEAMEEELKSMSTNKVWDLVSCKWVYKTKYDSKGKIKRFKARLVAKKFTQREGINYIKTFSPISKTHSESLWL